MATTKAVNLEMIGNAESVLVSLYRSLENLPESEKSGKTERIQKKTGELLSLVRKEYEFSASIELKKRIRNGEIDAREILSR